MSDKKKIYELSQQLEKAIEEQDQRMAHEEREGGPLHNSILGRLTNDEKNSGGYIPDPNLLEVNNILDGLLRSPGVTEAINYLTSLNRERLYGWVESEEGFNEVRELLETSLEEDRRKLGEQLQDAVLRLDKLIELAEAGAKPSESPEEIGEYVDKLLENSQATPSLKYMSPQSRGILRGWIESEERFQHLLYELERLEGKR